MTLEQILGRADQIAASGGTEIHMVGGLHPTWRFGRYIEILRTLNQGSEISDRAFLPPGSVSTKKRRLRLSP